MFDAEKANDKILQGLAEEEKIRGRDLEKLIAKLPVYQHVFEKVTGCGPRIAGAIIAAVKDIRRFETPAKFVAFCGVHVSSEGGLPRRRIGKTSNWNPEARQALYLLGDQFNRRPASTWGQRLLENKRLLRERHPEAIEVEGKKRYTDGHIHKMALWRTVTQFTNWLYVEWWKLERQPA